MWQDTLCNNCRGRVPVNHLTLWFEYDTHQLRDRYTEMFNCYLNISQLKFLVIKYAFYLLHVLDIHFKTM